MAAYSPTPVVEINGVIYDNVINDITINGGRTNVDEQPRPNYSSISLIETSETYLPVQLNDSIQVSVLYSSGIDPIIFRGFVSDIQREIVGYGKFGGAYIITLSAIGNLARLQHYTGDTSYPKQFDGERILALIGDALMTSWEEIDPTLTWAAYDPALTWANVDAGYVGNIDPGAYELTAYSGDAQSVVTMVDDAANSALGILWEAPTGEINYSDAFARKDRVDNYGYVIVDADQVAPNISVTNSIANIFNEFTVTYKNGQTKFAENLLSVGEFGRLAGQKSTILEEGAAAQAQVDLYINTRSNPRDVLSSITIPLHNPDLPDAVRDSLIGVFCGLPLQVDNLPTAIVPIRFQGFVEGYQWKLTRETAFLTLNVSEYGLSALTTDWYNVDSALVWSGVDAGLQWFEATTI